LKNNRSNLNLSALDVNNIFSKVKFKEGTPRELQQHNRISRIARGRIDKISKYICRPPCEDFVTKRTPNCPIKKRLKKTF
jgi:hypothetical protein